MKDYKLSEVKEICESAKDCGGCPLRYDERHCILEVNMKKWNFDKETDKEVRKDAIIDFAQTVIKCLDDDPILQMAVKRVAFGKFGVEVEE